MKLMTRKQYEPSPVVTAIFLDLQFYEFVFRVHLFLIRMFMRKYAVPNTRKTKIVMFYNDL